MVKTKKRMAKPHLVDLVRVIVLLPVIWVISERVAYMILLQLDQFRSRGMVRLPKISYRARPYQRARNRQRQRRGSR